MLSGSGFFSSPDPDSGAKKEVDPGSGYATLPATLQASMISIFLKIKRAIITVG
jgi:hypothetical protein